MKDAKVINDLIDKYRNTYEELTKNLELYHKQLIEEKDPIKQDLVRFDKFIPEGIKLLILLDKLNLLFWLTIPGGKDLPPETEDIKELKGLTKLYGDMSKESVSKIWESLNTVLQTIKSRLITCQQIMDKLNEFRRNIQ